MRYEVFGYRCCNHTRTHVLGLYAKHILWPLMNSGQDNTKPKTKTTRDLVIRAQSLGFDIFFVLHRVVVLLPRRRFVHARTVRAAQRRHTSHPTVDFGDQRLNILCVFFVVFERLLTVFRRAWAAFSRVHHSRFISWQVFRCGAVTWTKLCDVIMRHDLLLVAAWCVFSNSEDWRREMRWQVSRTFDRFELLPSLSGR